MGDKVFEVLRELAMPMKGNVPGVYLLFQGERVVYVGQSWNCFLGVAEQTRKEHLKDFDRWSYIREPDEGARRSLVKELISAHSPDLNKL